MAVGGCSWGECGRPVRASSLCVTHYNRRSRGSDMDAPFRAKRIPGQTCSFKSCSKPVWAKSLCNSHYDHLDRYGEPRHILQGFSGETCIFPGCDRTPNQLHSLCVRHYNRAGKFNLSPVQLIQLVAVSNCSVCGEHLTESTAHIDHDHSCCPGKRSCGDCIRGVLCSGCNVGLGAFRDDIGRLKSAVQYLMLTS